jgi:hypothetical protein
VTVTTDDPFTIRMDAPPAIPDGPAGFALYAWLGEPDPGTLSPLPFELGLSCMPMPLAPGSPAPSRIWNNLGRVSKLGVPDFPSTPAPSLVFRKVSGVGVVATFYLQGLIEDPGSAQGQGALTNGIVVRVR